MYVNRHWSVNYKFKVHIKLHSHVGVEADENDRLANRQNCNTRKNNFSINKIQTNFTHIVESSADSCVYI